MARIANRKYNDREENKKMQPKMINYLNMREKEKI